MHKGIVFAGNLIVDEIKYIESYPAPQTLTTIQDVVRSPGGLVCNCAADLAKLDPTVPVSVIGVVGEDEKGDYILETLSRLPSVNTAGIVRQCSTSYTDVMTDPRGKRTFFQFRGANALLGPEHFDFASIRADILHIGYILLLDKLDGEDSDYPTAMCRVLQEAREAGLLTSIDVVSEDSDRYTKLVPPALPYTDYCIINEVEAERTTGVPLRTAGGDVLRENLQRACEALLQMGVGRWAVIHMPELSCGMGRDGGLVLQECWYVPDNQIKSSVGAGDAFATGMLYGIYQGWTLERCLYIAGAVGAHSLFGAGASDAILPLTELLQNMEPYRR